METVDFEGLVLEGIAARKMRDGTQWTLGDLALQVETHYGEGDLEHYAKAIEVDYGSLRRFKATAQAFENARRRANLSYTHHERLASREDRHEWLAKAASAGWSVRRMLSEVEADDEKRRWALLAQQTQVPREEAPKVLDTIEGDDKEALPAEAPTIVTIAQGEMHTPDDDDDAAFDDDGDEGEEQRDDAWDETEPRRKRDKLAPWPLSNERNITWANAAHRRFRDTMAYLSGMMMSLPEAKFGKIAAVATDEDYKIWHGTIRDARASLGRVSKNLETTRAKKQEAS